MMKSIWEEDSLIPSFGELKEDAQADTVVVGGGLTGVLTAYLLKEAGQKVVLLERDRIACGNTKNTTAKITAQHGAIYHKLLKIMDEEVARGYAKYQISSLHQYEKIIGQKRIDCDFVHLPAVLYCTDKEDRTLEKERKACRRLGIEAETLEETRLPMKVASALCMKDQAQFHPLKFIAALVKELDCYEHTMVREIKKDHLITEKGMIVRANHIVVASHFPIITFPGAYYIKLHQEQSSILALRGPEPLDAMYLGVGKDSFSFRTAGDCLLLGGGQRRSGDKGEPYALLEEKQRRWYPQAQIQYRFTAQDGMSADEMPYIGRYSPSMPQVYVAAGFNKWGMTNAMTAARVLKGQITGEHGETIFSPSRFHMGETPALLKQTGHAVESIALRFLYQPFAKAEALKPQTGRIVRHNGKKVGAYRDGEGNLFFVQAKCPHLGCQLEFNNQDKTWDCPCHGSRFDYRGRLLDSPALKSIAIDENHKN